LTLSNLSPQSITISWLTDNPTSTQLTFTTDQNFLQNLKSAKDDRDQNNAQSRNSHLVTLSDLQPNTNYYYKIGQPIFFNPSQQFSTPSQTTNSSFSPLVGSVINNQSEPVVEAQITLQVPNYFPLSTYTTSNGSFVLPLLPLYQQNDLSKVLDLSQNPDVLLTITKDNQVSKINLHLNNKLGTLPPIILGQNLDLTSLPVASTSNIPQPSPSPAFNFDVTGDGKINSLDLITVQNNLGKKKFNPKADINSDGVVDQKDLDLLKQALQTKPQ